MSTPAAAAPPAKAAPATGNKQSGSSEDELPSLARVIGDANTLMRDNPGAYAAEALLYKASSNRERAFQFALTGVFLAASTRYRWPSKPWQRMLGSWFLAFPFSSSYGAYKRSDDLKWQLHLARSSKLETVCPYMPAYATKYALARASEGPQSSQLSGPDFVIFEHYQPVCDAFTVNMRKRGLRAQWDKQTK
jgi:hypothetical protein